jgi:exosortase
VRIRIYPWLAAVAGVGSLAWLWYVLINQLRVEWSLNPQYHYAWAVPFLCVYLLWKRVGFPRLRVMGWDCSRPMHPSSSGRATGADDARSFATCRPALDGSERPFRVWAVLLIVCALFYGPARLIQEANPDWRLVSWTLSLAAVGATLGALGVCGFRVSDFALPMGFFLIAVPWPTVIEGPLIQSMARLNASATVEVLGLFGIPAVQHGNVIEVAAGVVGIDEACSGIRSFQATLMLSLFFGEMYRLSVRRRLCLCLLGVGLSFIFNVGRSVLLTAVAAREGVAAIERWHDPAGVTILVGCFTGLWLAGLGLRGKSETGGRRSEIGDAPSNGTLWTLASRQSLWRRFVASGERPAAWFLALGAWVVVVELGTAVWYRSRERRLPPPVEWTVRWPTEMSGYRELPFGENERRFLRFDEGRNAVWQEADGRRWQAIFLRWNPGRIGVYVARSHTPEVCLTAVGRPIVWRSDNELVSVNGMALPIRFYRLGDAGRFLDVAYCHWEDRAPEQGRSSGTMQLTYRNRLEAVRSGRRNLGQRSLELAVWDCATLEEAWVALRKQLERLIQPPRTMQGAPQANAGTKVEDGSESRTPNLEP